MTLNNWVLRALPLIVLVSVSILVLVAYTYEKEEQRKLSIPEMYLRAVDYENEENIQYAKALEIYSKIIVIDRTEERAWHEKGRILNHLERCSESFEHYNEYLKVFPNSERASEGFEIAKEC